MKANLSLPIRSLAPHLSGYFRSEAAYHIRLRRKYGKGTFTLANARALVLYRFA